MMNVCRHCVWWEPNQAWFKEGMHSFCLNPKVAIVTQPDFGCPLFMGSDATEVNVPQHTPNGMLHEPNPNPVDGPVEILIVTYNKDLPWLYYCLRSIRRHCTGFQGVTVAHPNHEASLFAPLVPKFDVRLHGYDEVEGKGMLQHMVKLASPDQFLPAATKYVLTCDADCIFRMPTTPEHYFANDKPYYIFRSWASLTTEHPYSPGSKIVSDCHQWKGPTDRQVGFDTTIFGMCMNTVVFPMDFFPRYRAHVSAVHHRPFDEFMLDGQNTFPQSNMDFTAMGAYAHRFMHDRWHWYDVEKPPYPVDRKKAYHSHSGLGPAIREEIEGFLK
jgi:hypothetical protein